MYAIAWRFKGGGRTIGHGMFRYSLMQAERICAKGWNYPTSRYVHFPLKEPASEEPESAGRTL